VRTFTHDGGGNVTADDRAGTTYNYRTNNRGRLDRASVGAQVRADYVYDALERLAIRTTQNMTPSGTTHYVYNLAGRLLAEATDTGTTVREYIWLDDMPLAVVADVDTATPQLWTVHADHLDRPVKMTDGTKAVVWDAVFRPFGEVVSITGSASNNLRFPGQYFLIEAGLHYNWHRHYDPTLGRYVQPDPMGFVDGPNRYGYARLSPLQYVDPDGRFIFHGFGTGAAIGGFGPVTSVGIGYDTLSGTVDSYVSPGAGVGVDWGAGGSVGFFFGTWCQFSGAAVNLNVSFLGVGGSISFGSGTWGFTVGYTRGPAVFPAGISVTRTETFLGFEGARCGCRGK
jgi:RHS repeat-associated protein